MDYRKRYIEKNPEKHHAQTLVATAIRYGRLKKLPCEVCGNPKVHAHHDDYNKPLEVIWLCPTHHRDHHSRERGFVVGGKRKRNPNPTRTRPKHDWGTLGPKALSMRSDGFSYAAISAELSVSRSQVFKWLNDVEYN